MSRYLLYCVCADDDGDDFDADGLKGVEGAAVFVLKAGGLAAAVSKADESVSVKVENLLEFTDVVKACHRKRTVIPMRFGSFFESESEVLNALKGRAKRYGARLETLDGCSEMGIRIMTPAPAAPRVDSERKDKNPGRSAGGKAFLMGRKAFYDRQESIPAKTGERIRRIKETLAGVYTETRCEHKYLGTDRPGRGGRVAERVLLVSLFFLVPDAMTEKFRSLCRDIGFSPHVKMLVSGPWPPFSFVSDESDFAGSSK